MMIVTHPYSQAGRYFAQTLIDHNFRYIVAVGEQAADEQPFSSRDVWHHFSQQDLLPWLEKENREVEFVIHIEGNSGFDQDLAKTLWQACINYQIPFIYASSSIHHGFHDWAQSQPSKPFFWAGIQWGTDAPQDWASFAINLISTRKNSGVFSV